LKEKERIGTVKEKVVGPGQVTQKHQSLLKGQLINFKGKQWEKSEQSLHEGARVINRFD
jgi:hypothetical protein